MKQKKVRLYRTAPVWVRSWLAYLFALAILGAFWYACYLAVDAWADKYTNYFTIGAYAGLILGIILIIFNEPIVKLTTGAKRVKDRQQNPKLWDAVEKATPWLGKPRPRIYLVSSGGMNAFAFGWGLPFMSAVAATSGAVEELTDDELTAVMAHEIGHIINKDILISMSLAITVMIIGFTGYILFRLAPYGGGRSSRSSSSSSGSGLMILVALVVGGIMYLFGRLLGYVLQMFVSRQREYAADATSAQIMGTSRHLISALRKISGNAHVSYGKSEAAITMLCTADPDPSDFLSTHPEMRKRLRALAALES